MMSRALRPKASTQNVIDSIPLAKEKMIAA
jgi:hypothetical protein